MYVCMYVCMYICTNVLCVYTCRTIPQKLHKLNHFARSVFSVLYAVYIHIFCDVFDPCTVVNISFIWYVKWYPFIKAHALVHFNIFLYNTLGRSYALHGICWSKTICILGKLNNALFYLSSLQIL